MDFRTWFRQDEMARFNHGKNSQRMSDIYGQHVDDVPDDHWYWNWAHNKMKSDPNYWPGFKDDDDQNMSRDAVQQMLQKRSSGQKYAGDRQPQMQPQSADGRKWTLAKADGYIPNVDPDIQQQFFKDQADNVVVLGRRSDGNWDMMNRAGRIQVVTHKDVAQVATSMKNAQGGFIQSVDPQELFGQVEDPKDPAKLGDAEAAPLDNFKEKKQGRPKPQDVRIPDEMMTSFNRDIDNKFAQTDESMMMDALAGTGKTTMLKHLSSYIKPGEKWLYLVFNKKNQLESQDEFPKGVDVKTTHSFLGNLLKTSGKESGGNTNLPPEGAKWQKIYKITDKLIPIEWPESVHNYWPRKGKNAGEEVSPFNWKAKSVTTKLTSLAKSFALDPSSPTIEQDLMGIIEKYNMDMDLSSEKIPQDRDFTPDIIKMVTQLLQVTLPGKLPPSLGKEFANYRDQDDTLWYAALYADQINWNLGYNVVLMDEVQDFNMCQLVMAKKLREAGARVIGVGDPNQSMYMFRGADAEAFEKLKNMLTDGQEAMPLPINFRSGENIINYVKENTHVKDLQAAPHMAGKGSVDDQTPYQDFLDGLQQEWQTGKKFTEPTAIICRTNAPLAKAALNFLKTGIDFQIIGKDLSRELVQHIKKVTWSKPEMHQVENFADTLGEYYGSLEDEWANKISKRDELKEIDEITSTLLAVLHFLEEKGWKEDEGSRPITNVREFMQFIQKKLSGLDPNESMEDSKKLKAKDPNSFVTLTTAHKSKGLEYDRVMVLNPSAFNPEGDKIRTEGEAQQERNAWYVALTRAKNTLHIAEEEDKQKLADLDGGYDEEY